MAMKIDVRQTEPYADADSNFEICRKLTCMPFNCPRLSIKPPSSFVATMRDSWHILSLHSAKHLSKLPVIVSWHSSSQLHIGQIRRRICQSTYENRRRYNKTCDSKYIAAYSGTRADVTCLVGSGSCPRSHPTPPWHRCIQLSESHHIL